MKVGDIDPQFRGVPQLGHELKKADISGEGDIEETHQHRQPDAIGYRFMARMGRGEDQECGQRQGRPL